MTILFLSSTHHADDRRVVALQAASLAAAGFAVLHLCRDGRAPPPGVPTRTLRRRPGLPGRLAMLPRLLAGALRARPATIQASEPDTWAVALLAKGLTGCRVVFDVHEDYADPHRLTRLPAWLRRPAAGAIRAAFRLMSRWTDAAVLATPVLAERFPAGPDRPPRVLVRNLVPRAEAEAMPRATPEAGGPLRLVALGAMGRARGWPVALAALARAADPTIRLEVIGPFTDGSAADFAATAARLGLADRATATGPLPRPQALARAAEAQAALVLFAPGAANHAAALPHKLFEAMALGLPVVVAETCRPAAALVRRTGCGLVVDSADPAAVASAFATLAADPTLRARMGAAGRRALAADYAWEEDASRLAALHRRLARAREEAPPHAARRLSDTRHPSPR
ncbi:glycosyltransferase [Elioraea tepidiphila]|jgi:glycosyltransferase involved in cell wall biosynthesis|uniref:glycosyltransferase n=2 Tax=Elioraea tepidiphila TaxID=457934 RepID=UPI00036ACFFA|nr:glycosyltransferase [Elioraea tepidiphila]